MRSLSGDNHSARWELIKAPLALLVDSTRQISPPISRTFKKAALSAIQPSPGRTYAALQAWKKHHIRLRRRCVARSCSSFSLPQPYTKFRGGTLRCVIPCTIHCHILRQFRLRGWARSYALCGAPQLPNDLEGECAAFGSSCNRSSDLHWHPNCSCPSRHSRSLELPWPHLEPRVAWRI